MRHAIATQGALLEQHGQRLQDVMGGFHRLNTRLTEIQAAPGPPPAAVSTREPWVSPPERYDGHLGNCKTFLLQCGLVFDLQPLTYSTEKARIAYLISFFARKGVGVGGCSLEETGSGDIHLRRLRSGDE